MLGVVKLAPVAIDATPVGATYHMAVAPVEQIAPNVTVPVPQIAAGVTVGGFGIGLTVTPVVAVTEHLLPLIAVKVTVTV